MKTEQIERIYKDSPKAAAEVENWLYKKMEEVPDGLKQFDTLKGEFAKKKTYTTKFYLQMGPRFLYEFFDEKGIYTLLNISRAVGEFNSDWEDADLWWKPIVTGSNREELDMVRSRTEAEHAAFEEAFKILEGRYDREGSNTTVQGIFL